MELLLDIRKRFSGPSVEHVSILLVSRRGTRSFDKNTLRALTRNLENLHETVIVSLYDGDEDALRTVEMFHSAHVVIHFHGAAAANIVFCEENTTVLELTVFQDFNGTRKWRTNAPFLRAFRPNIKIGVYHLPLNVAFPALSSSLLAASDDVDLLIKGQSEIQLGGVEHEVILDFVRDSLTHSIPLNGTISIVASGDIEILG